jgi:hypothetical protein
LLTKEWTITADSEDHGFSESAFVFFNFVGGGGFGGLFLHFMGGGCFLFLLFLVNRLVLQVVVVEGFGDGLVGFAVGAGPLSA